MAEPWPARTTRRTFRVTVRRDGQGDVKDELEEPIADGERPATSAERIGLGYRSGVEDPLVGGESVPRGSEDGRSERLPSGVPRTFHQTGACITKPHSRRVFWDFEDLGQDQTAPRISTPLHPVATIHHGPARVRDRPYVPDRVQVAIANLLR